MLKGFQKYLVEQGFKRTKDGQIEDYESYYISTYVNIGYMFERGEIYFFWGLGIKGYAPYYYLPKQVHLKIVLSGDNEKDINDIISGEINKICLV